MTDICRNVESAGTTEGDGQGASSAYLKTNLGHSHRSLDFHCFKALPSKYVTQRKKFLIVYTWKIKPGQTI